jgi:hypothetical protein
MLMPDLMLLMIIIIILPPPSLSSSSSHDASSCRITTRLLDFSMFYLPVHGQPSILQSLLLVKNLHHIFTLLLMMMTTVTCLRILYKRKAAVITCLFIFVMVCVWFEWKTGSRMDVRSASGMKSGGCDHIHRVVALFLFFMLNQDDDIPCKHFSSKFSRQLLTLPSRKIPKKQL